MAINTFRGREGGAQKARYVRAASCPKASSKDSNQRTSRWLPALTRIGMPMPEKSLETHRRRALGPKSITRVLVPGRREGQSQKYDVENKAGVTKGPQAKECRQCLEAGKSKETLSPPEPSEGTSPAHTGTVGS